MVRQRNFRRSGDDRSWSDGRDDREDRYSGGAAAWQDYSASPASSYYDNGTWSWDSQQSQQEQETWVLWCDRHGIFRAMLKIGECNIHTGDTRIRYPQAAVGSAFVVDMSVLLPFDWSLVDKPAPP